MPGARRDRFRGSIQTLFAAGTFCGLSDRQLLERFLASRDEVAEMAFAAAGRAARADGAGGLPAHPGRFRTTLRTPFRRRSSSWSSGRAHRVEGSLGKWLFGVASTGGNAGQVRDSTAADSRAARGCTDSRPRRTRKRRRGRARRAAIDHWRGTGPAAGAIPGPGRDLRSGGCEPRGGCPAAGRAGRDGQEPAARAGPAARTGSLGEGSSTADLANRRPAARTHDRRRDLVRATAQLARNLHRRPADHAAWTIPARVSPTSPKECSRPCS